MLCLSCPAPLASPLSPSGCLLTQSPSVPSSYQTATLAGPHPSELYPFSPEPLSPWHGRRSAVCGPSPPRECKRCEDRLWGSCLHDGVSVQEPREYQLISEWLFWPSPGLGSNMPSFHVTGELAHLPCAKEGQGRGGRQPPPGQGSHVPPGAAQHWAGSPGSYRGPSSGNHGTPQTWGAQVVAVSLE